MTEIVLLVVGTIVGIILGYLIANRKIQLPTPTVVPTPPSEIIADQVNKETDAQDKAHVQDTNSTTLFDELYAKYGSNKTAGSSM